MLGAGNRKRRERRAGEGNARPLQEPGDVRLGLGVVVVSLEEVEHDVGPAPDAARSTAHVGSCSSPSRRTRNPAPWRMADIASAISTMVCSDAESGWSSGSRG